MIALPRTRVFYYKRLRAAFGIEFRQQALYEQALTTRAYHHTVDPRALHSEQLEFVGDAVLAEKVSLHLYQRMPRASVLVMHAVRQMTERNTWLAVVAKTIELDQCLHATPQEMGWIEAGESRGRRLLANAVEALIGAAVQDHGITGPDTFLQRYILPHADDVLRKYGSRLQPSERLLSHIARERFGQTLDFQVVRNAVNGTVQAKVFAKIDGRVRATGRGRSIGEARQAAAQGAMAWMNTNLT